jgi:hypothetical protein
VNKVFDKMKKWWHKLAEGRYVLVLRKDSFSDFVKSKLHEKLREDANIRATYGAEEALII